MTVALLMLPWLGVLAFLLFVARLPTELPPVRSSADGEPRADVPGSDAPLVSVIVPARNEEVNIRNCLESLAASRYPRFEIIVVDDRSEDRTAALARACDPGRAERLLVVDGTDLPDGWLGKPWACAQGATQARGELLLFTDADTTHGADLLSRAVAGRAEEDADLLTLLGRQLMETFWERLVQPQVFLTMLFRFPDFERTAANGRWRDAIANGQFLLFKRSSYDAIGGHEAVRDEVVEDLVLAQVVKRAGLKLRVRRAEADLATRMYRSLGQLVEGWSKNIVMGGLQSVPPIARRLMPPVAFAGGVGLWILPPVSLVMSALGWGGPQLLGWSIGVCVVSVAIWATFTARMGGPARYGLLYPLGAGVGTYIFLRSWIRGRDVEWKGRRYHLPRVLEILIRWIEVPARSSRRR